MGRRLKRRRIAATQRHFQLRVAIAITAPVTVGSRRYGTFGRCGRRRCRNRRVTFPPLACECRQSRSEHERDRSEQRTGHATSNSCKRHRCRPAQLDRRVCQPRDRQLTPRAASKPSTTLTILVTNDDGVSAPGINATVQALTALPHTKVTVVAPLTNQSGTGPKVTGGTVTATERHDGERVSGQGRGGLSRRHHHLGHRRPRHSATT